MAINKIELISSAIIISSLFLLFILDTAKIITNYMGTTIFNTMIYFTVCCLHANRIFTLKWRVWMVVLSLGIVALIISSRLYIPLGWDFVSRLIFGMDTVAMVAFMLIIFTQDQRSTILFTTFVTVIFLIFNNLANQESFNVNFTVVVSVIVYAILSIFHIKHIKQISYRRWKVAAIALTFPAILAFVILLCRYWYDGQKLFILVASIDCCLSLLPLMWCAPKLKAWWEIYLKQEMTQDEQDRFLEMSGLPTRFTIKELDRATANFEAPIGEGASGAVFKGTLADGSRIAVKRIKWQQSGETEFRTEITIIASLQHFNLVRLLGYCLSPQGNQYLVYPFFENGSLDSWLFNNDTKRSHLKWSLRYQIAIDVAKALAYLHHECHHRILHLDIKPANILLDGSFRALVSDFGISKLIERDESSVMTRARGTIGYLAPEMLVPNAISTKSDVYSYGMVLLELVGGRKNFMSVLDQESQQQRSSYFPKIVREKMMQGRLMEVVDECLLRNELIKEEEVMVLVRLALWCIQENPELRLSMKDVAEMVEGRKPVLVPPESPMYVVKFLDMESQSRMAPQKDQADILSANMLTITIQSGR